MENVCVARHMALSHGSPIRMNPSSVRWYFGFFSLPSVSASFSAWIFWKTKTDGFILISLSSANPSVITAVWSKSSYRGKGSTGFCCKTRNNKNLFIGFKGFYIKSIRCSDQIWTDGGELLLLLDPGKDQVPWLLFLHLFFRTVTTGQFSDLGFKGSRF